MRDDWATLVGSAAQSSGFDATSVQLPTGRDPSDPFGDMPVTRSFTAPDSQPTSTARASDLGWDSTAPTEGLPATQDPSKMSAFAANQVRMEVNKPYSGPMVGQPDSARWGEPGWDCSSLVAGVFAKQGIKMTPFTDAAYDETVPLDSASPRAGDVVFFKYADRSQPRVKYPHMALYLGQDEHGTEWIADANYGKGKVVVEPMLNLPHEIRRPAEIAQREAAAGGR